MGAGSSQQTLKRTYRILEDENTYKFKKYEFGLQLVEYKANWCKGLKITFEPDEYGNIYEPLIVMDLLNNIPDSMRYDFVLMSETNVSPRYIFLCLESNYQKYKNLIQGEDIGWIGGEVSAVISTTPSNSPSNSPSISRKSKNRFDEMKQDLKKSDEESKEKSNEKSDKESKEESKEKSNKKSNEESREKSNEKSNEESREKPNEKPNEKLKGKSNKKLEENLE